MTDLKFIDELLCEIRSIAGMSWYGMENYSNLTRRAMIRLREAYTSGQMPLITLSLADYFKETRK